MSIGVPELEERSFQVRNKDSMKVVVDTIKALHQAIAEAQADTKHDHSVAILQLKENLNHMFSWGKHLQGIIKGS